ncbi:MAG TPA: hypothetical protein VHZ51_27550 [Ktedonobacteraceae bacterium]|nr:hypothetical protein [Ktedonobacteraceae bacterium]
MKEVTPKDGSTTISGSGRSRAHKRRLVTHCSVCTCRIWFEPYYVTEPEEVAEPRLSWTLCKGCYHALLSQLRQSPVHSPLRLRVAMGLVAAERWPQAYPTLVKNYIYDRRWIVFIATFLVIAMLLHLVIIVMIAGMR